MNRLTSQSLLSLLAVLCTTWLILLGPTALAVSKDKPYVRLGVYVKDEHHDQSHIVFAGERADLLASLVYGDFDTKAVVASKWSVDAIPGGNADVGTITAEGTGGLEHYQAPSNGIGIVTISCEYKWPDGHAERLSYPIYVVNKRWQYRASAGLGYLCNNGILSADVHSIGEMEVTFHLKRDNDLDRCVAEVEQGPTVTKDDHGGKGSCDPSVETHLSFGRPMEVSGFSCVYTGSDNIMKIEIPMHFPDCPGYANTMIATKQPVAVQAVKVSPDTKLTPTIHVRPHVLQKSPSLHSPGMNVRTASELTALPG